MIADISKWIEDETKTTSVLWLHGTAGIGKSAIAQHIAEKYAETRLAAAFFFSRSDPTRDNIYPFIASIAYQLCKVGSLSHPMLCSKIIEAIGVDPNVLEASCEVQLRNLIIEPCLRVDPPSWNAMRNLLVIDGLDECVDRSSQRRVLELILRLISAVFPPSWIVFLCSRPESQIRDGVEQIRSLRGFLKEIDMNEQEDLNRDIARYLTDEFSRIRRERRRVLGTEGAVWPGDNVIDELVRRADKQMIFAATIIKFIDSDDEPPQDRLETVRQIFVEVGSDSPYAALDALYHQILSTCGKWDKVQPVLQLLVTPHSYHDTRTPWRSPAMIARFLDVREAQVLVTLDKLHSVLRIPSGNGDEHPENVYVAHATFTEFLGDCSRSAEFYTPKMSESEYCEFVALFSLRTLSDLAHHYPPYHIHSFADATLVWEGKWDDINIPLQRLVMDGWTYWAGSTFPLSINLVKALSDFDPYHFICLWFREQFTQFLGRIISQADSSMFGYITRPETRIELAKSRESLLPRQFIESLELLEGIEVLNLAFPPDTEGNLVFWGTRWMEQWLRRPPAISSLTLVDAFLPPRWSASHGFLVLPPDSPHCRISALKDWIIVPIMKMKENSELESRVYYDLYAQGCGRWQQSWDVILHAFLEDIRNSTNYTISKGIVREDDLSRFRCLLKERLKMVRRLAVELHDAEDPEAFWSWQYV
ncbi:hypothetical protein VNI00_012676 [Paramarasmius palmivorus]|uniref:NACHT domain-containing protein n=1 Tax=Paramarasmius palmivorus TaxID=297713 RepID=A0AAW0C560_9AGAR